jgi:hypothetical protein
MLQLARQAVTHLSGFLDLRARVSGSVERGRGAQINLILLISFGKLAKS